MKTLTNEQSGFPDPPIPVSEVSSSQLPQVELFSPTPLGSSIVRPMMSIEKKAETLAQRRNESKEDAGTVYGSYAAETTHKVGCMGELVAMSLGLGLNADTMASGDPGWDHDFGRGTVDVKATATDSEKPKLIVDAADTPPADYFLLVHIREDEGIGRIIGFRDGKSVLSREPQHWPGDTANYVLDWSDLYPPRYFTPLVMSRSILDTRDDGYLSQNRCQLCRLPLRSDVRNQIYVDELETTITVGSDTCISLVEAAKEQGVITDFPIYQHPPQDGMKS